MNDTEYRAFLDLLMCSDPWPVPDTGNGDGHDTLESYADAEAQKRGYEKWIVAYHKINRRLNWRL